MINNLVKTVVILFTTVFFYSGIYGQNLTKLLAKNGINCEEKKAILVIKAGSCLNCLSNVKDIIHFNNKTIVLLSGVRSKEASLYLKEKLQFGEDELKKTMVINDDSIFQILSPNGHHLYCIIEKCEVISSINLGDDTEVKNYLKNVVITKDSITLEENSEFVLNSFCKLRELGAGRLVAFNQVLNKLAILNKINGHIIKIIKLTEEEESMLQKSFFNTVLCVRDSVLKKKYNKHLEFIKQGNLKIYPTNYDIYNGQLHVFYQIEYPEFIDSISAYKRYGICISRIDSQGHRLSNFLTIRNSSQRPDCFTESGVSFDFKCIDEITYKIQVLCDPIHLDINKNKVFVYYKVNESKQTIELDRYSEQLIPNEFYATNLYYNLLTSFTVNFNHKELSMFSSLPKIYDQNGKILTELIKISSDSSSDSIESYLRSHYFYLINSKSNNSLFVVKIDLGNYRKEVYKLASDYSLVGISDFSDLQKSDMIQFECAGYIYYTGQRGEDYFLFKRKFEVMK